jgi:hypothetical protein
MLICYLAATFTLLLPEPKHERMVAKPKKKGQNKMRVLTVVSFGHQKTVQSLDA